MFLAGAEAAPRRVAVSAGQRRSGLPCDLTVGGAVRSMIDRAVDRPATGRVARSWLPPGSLPRGASLRGNRAPPVSNLQSQTLPIVGYTRNT